MSQKYKIFANGKLLFLVRNPAEVEEVLSTEIPFIIQPVKDKKHFDTLMSMLLGDINHSSMILYGKSIDDLLARIIGHFRYVEAAGGVVHNSDGEILLIHRRGSWDLPKGKLEKGESLEQAAVREVMEETGLSGIDLQERIAYPGYQNTCTYHTYRENGEWILKGSHWFRMLATGSPRLTPQSEEDIAEAIWVPREELPHYFREMYPSIVDVLKADLQLVDLPEEE